MNIEKIQAFADCWSDTDRAFYEWCEGYLDFPHIKSKKIKNDEDRSTDRSVIQKIMSIIPSIQ